MGLITEMGELLAERDERIFALRDERDDLRRENEALWAGLQAALDLLAEAYAENERLTTPVMVSLDAPCFTIADVNERMLQDEP